MKELDGYRVGSKGIEFYEVRRFSYLVDVGSESCQIPINLFDYLHAPAYIHRYLSIVDYESMDDDTREIWGTYDAHGNGDTPQVTINTTIRMIEMHLASR